MRAHFPKQRLVIEPSQRRAKVELLLSIEFSTAVARRVKQAYVILSLLLRPEKTLDIALIPSVPKGVQRWRYRGYGLFIHFLFNLHLNLKQGNMLRQDFVVDFDLLARSY